MLQRFKFAVFSKGPPATNRESPRGEERGGEREVFAFLFRPLLRTALALPFPFLGLSEKHSSRIPPGKEKVRFLRSRSLTLGSRRRKTKEPICTRLRVPRKE